MCNKFGSASSSTGGVEQTINLIIMTDSSSVISRVSDYASDRINRAVKEAVSGVNHPSHYNHGGMETIDKMIKLYGIEKVKAFCELNAFKYRDRAGYKGSSDSAIARDIHKALWYENKFNELNNK